MVKYGIDCSPMEYGFIDYNGNLWCDAWVNSYNNYSRHIASVSGDSPMCYAERDAIADRRHEFFARISSSRDFCQH